MNHTPGQGDACDHMFFLSDELHCNAVFTSYNRAQCGAVNIVSEFVSAVIVTYLL